MLFITAVSSNCSKYVSWFIVHCFFLNTVTFYVKKWNYRITVICLFLLAVNKLNSIQPTNIRVIILIQNYYLNCWLLNKLKIIFIGINSDYFWTNFFLPHEVISLSFQ